MRARQRFTAIEYTKSQELPKEISRRSGIPIDSVGKLLLKAGERLRNPLELESNPIGLTADGVQFQNISGLLLLAPGLELEIAPKFLGDTPNWREDFFFLSSLTHHGRLLNRDTLQASSGTTSALSSLIARSLVEMYWRNQRHPLRVYQRLWREEFSIDGDFDAVDLVIPNDEGFAQQVTLFTRKNPHNAVIRAAAESLFSSVDTETRAKLARVSQHLPRQAAPIRIRNQRLPNRSHSWQPIYDLALDILRGLGGTFDPKNVLAPGFVMKSWQVWEHLVSMSLRIAFGSENVSIHPKHTLGLRMVQDVTSSVSVIPDGLVTFNFDGIEHRVIVDAKYKSNINHRQLSLSSAFSVSNADIYEALAFSRATGAKKVLFVYPQQVDRSRSQKEETGYSNELSTISIEGTNIHAIEMGICGVSKPGGLRRFVAALKSSF